jgi:hypothetical protein
VTDRAETEVVEALAAMLHEVRDPGWAEVAVEIAFAGGFSQFRTWFRTTYDGHWEPTGRYAHRAEDFAAAFHELRRLMYRPGPGTWFSARLTVSDQGDYRSDYDFDHKPRFDPPVARQLYLDDLRAFPRDPSRIPAWVTEPR